MIGFVRPSLEELRIGNQIISPARIVVKATDVSKGETPPPANQLWQTAFTYLKATGLGWLYLLLTILDGSFRYVGALQLCSTMKADDVIETLDDAPATARLDEVGGADGPRLSSDNGSSYLADALALRSRHGFPSRRAPLRSPYWMVHPLTTRSRPRTQRLLIVR